MASALKSNVDISSFLRVFNLDSVPVYHLVDAGKYIVNNFKHIYNDLEYGVKNWN